MSSARRFRITDGLVRRRASHGQRLTPPYYPRSTGYYILASPPWAPLLAMERCPRAHGVERGTPGERLEIYCRRRLGILQPSHCSVPAPVNHRLLMSAARIRNARNARLKAMQMQI